MVMTDAAATLTKPSTKAEDLRVQVGNGNGKPEIEITPTNDIDNLNPGDNQVGGEVRATIGENGFLIFGGTQVPDTNGTGTDFSIGAGYRVGEFGIEATLNQPGTSEQNLDVIGEIGVSDDVSFRGGVENIGGPGNVNTTIELNGDVGGGTLTIEGNVSPNESSIEGNFELPLKENEK